MSLLEDAIEQATRLRMADQFNVDVDLIFCDTTSLHFEIDEEDDDVIESLEAPGCGREAGLCQRGHSENGRADPPQIVVGLAVTLDGLPVRSSSRILLRRQISSESTLRVAAFK